MRKSKRKIIVGLFILIFMLGTVSAYAAVNTVTFKIVEGSNLMIGAGVTVYLDNRVVFSGTTNSQALVTFNLEQGKTYKISIFAKGKNWGPYDQYVQPYTREVHIDI